MNACTIMLVPVELVVYTRRGLDNFISDILSE